MEKPYNWPRYQPQRTANGSATLKVPPTEDRHPLHSAAHTIPIYSVHNGVVLVACCHPEGKRSPWRLHASWHRIHPVDGSVGGWVWVGVREVQVALPRAGSRRGGEEAGHRLQQSGMLSTFFKCFSSVPFFIQLVQGLEGTHKEVKTNHTFRTELPLGQLIQMLEQLVILLAN